MKKRLFKRGFTLLEVNLAIFVMSTGVLTVCALYAMGYRENRQNVEDVAGVGYADAYLAPLVQGLSSTNMTWSSWLQIGSEGNNAAQSRGIADRIEPSDGWSAYVDHEQRTDKIAYRVKNSCNATADETFNKVLRQLPSPKGKRQAPSNGFYGLVVTRRGAVIQLAFRSSKRREMLMSAPIYVCEVRFQGDAEERKK